jgi:hypothetical protein
VRGVPEELREVAAKREDVQVRGELCRGELPRRHELLVSDALVEIEINDNEDVPDVQEERGKARRLRERVQRRGDPPRWSVRYMRM